MGFWGSIGAAIGRRATAVKEGLSEGLSTIKEKTKNGLSKVKEQTKNIWNKFSGKNTFEEAEKLYEEISRRYSLKRKAFERAVEDYTIKIENHVKAINKSKEKIKLELFPDMARKLEQIKDIEVSKDFSVEAYLAETVSIDGIRSKSQLYTIDFNKHKFKTTIQAIFTVGFYTRKKAKETLYAVKEEEKKLDTEIAKMDAELVKLKAIESSLENVEVYFSTLIELYENLLLRLDSSINYLFVKCMSFAHKLIHSEMSLKRLPKMNQKEVEAIITASKILKVMIDTQITAIEDKDKVVEYNRKLKVEHEKMSNIYDVA